MVLFHDILLEFSFHLKDNYFGAWNYPSNNVKLFAMAEFHTPKTIMVEESAIKIISKALAALGYDFYTEWFLKAVWLSTHNYSENHSLPCSYSTGSSFGLFQSLQCPIPPDKGDGSSGKEIELVRKYR